MDVMADLSAAGDVDIKNLLMVGRFSGNSCAPLAWMTPTRSTPLQCSDALLKWCRLATSLRTHS